MRHTLLKMKRNLHPVVRDGVVYGLIGAACLVLDLFFYGLLTRLFQMQYLAANVFSFLGTAVLNYLANRHFTYRESGKFRAKQLTKFLLIASIGVFLNTVFLGLFFGVFRVHDLVAKLLAAGVVFFWNFGMNRYWTFKHEKPLQFIDPL